MTKGDKFPVVDLRDYHKFDLIYNGIDDSNADYDDLKYKLETSAKISAWQQFVAELRRN